MRKVTLTLTIALLLAGSAVLTADAQTSRGADRIAAGAQNFTLIEPAACRGWGDPTAVQDLPGSAVGFGAGVGRVSGFLVPLGQLAWLDARSRPPQSAASQLGLQAMPLAAGWLGP
jgi:uncharacterized protein YceK